MTKPEFLGWASDQLIEAGVSIRILQKIAVKGCAGWFDSSKKELMVCAKHPDFFIVFVHEFCHFLQWRDDRKWWNKRMKGYCKFTDWLALKRKKNEGREDCQLVELDCEKRAVKLIRKLHLPVDIKTYIQKANSYLLFYLIVEKNRKWPKSGCASAGIYKPEVIKHYPAKFLKFTQYCDITNIPESNMKILTSGK
jgi:hypothetical protein